MPYIYEGSVSSDIKDIKTFVQDIMKKLNMLFGDEDLIFDLRLILNELIINGVVHGNKCNREKCVKLSLQVIEDKIKIEVIDEGTGIDFGEISYCPEELESTGRGLMLVNGLTDEVYIDRNRVVAVKRIN